MIFLELVTGRLPFKNNCPPIETLLSFSYFPEAEALLKSMEVPTAARRLILTMIAPDPAERPASHADLRKSLVSAFQKTDGFFSRFF
jgi:serine/threonine protein kinase